MVATKLAYPISLMVLLVIIIHGTHKIINRLQNHKLPIKDGNRVNLKW
jgi:hypothetical protein